MDKFYDTFTDKPPVKNDYLKYWMPVKHHMRKKHNLSGTDIDVILFLYSERYFTKAKFKEYKQLINWDITQFDRLVRTGWIEVFREKSPGAASPERRCRIYQLSLKAKRMVAQIYNILNGAEISEDPKYSPIFKKNVGYMDKVFRNFIIDINRVRRQQQPHLFRKSQQTSHPE